MLPNYGLSTPRPRPPAKMRRDPSLPFHPPPPYAPRMDMLDDSPDSVPAQLVAPPAEDATSLNTPTMETWIKEKSREELSDLLVAAEGLIKTRESELGLTSALCKNLYQENIQLKTTHDVLLARLPVQGPSPLPSPTRSLSPLPPGSPHYYSISRPQSPAPSSPVRARHTRHISVTPSELSLLADQNAELLDKLQKLEEESAEADLAGKRKLRKLEREISGLREELDKTRAKGAELEAKVAVGGEDEAIRLKKKEERAERTKALREKGGMSLAAEEPVRDFAPPPELPSVRDDPSLALSPASISLHLLAKSPIPFALPALPASKGASPLLENLPPLPLSDSEASSRPGSRLSSARSRARGSVGYLSPRSVVDQRHSPTPPPQLEYAIIAQLLAKIRELEDTNTQMTADQKVTAEKLQDVQWDAESIKRAYDALVDGDREVHVVTDDEADDEAEGSRADSSHSPPLTDSPESVKSSHSHKQEPTGDTIRFSSLRRSIDGNISRGSFSSGVFSTPASPDRGQVELDFAQGILKEMQSTTRSRLAELQGSMHYNPGNRSRKTVMGLFDNVEVADGADDNEENLDTPSFSRALSTSPAKFISKSEPDDLSAWSTDATDGALPSPAPSVSPLPSAAHSRTPSIQLADPGSTRRNPHTLGSEIGTDDWPADENARQWNYHLHGSSLCDITGGGSAENESMNAEMGDIEPDNDDSLDLPIQDVPVSVIAPSPSPSPPPKEPSPTSSGWEDVSDENEGIGLGITLNRSAGSAGTATPTKGSPLGRTGGLQLQLVVQPPTPSPDKVLRPSHSAHSLRGQTTGLLDDAGVRESRTNRNARLSQTVKARTNRWVEKVERRYLVDPDESIVVHETPTRSRKRKEAASAQSHARRISSAMDDTFDQVIVQFSRSNLAISAIAPREEKLEADTSMASCDGEADVSLSAEVMKARPRRDGFVGLLLEVWLWLQFAVVVMVFLWAMARRGPKSVLEDAERRRSSTTVVRRRTSN